MPIYEYACRSCDHAFETMQKASESPLKDCPACGEPQLKKLLSAPVFRLKGGGWYETDFKSGDKKRNLAGDAAENGAKSKSGDDGTKPAASTGAKSDGDGKSGSDSSKSAGGSAASATASAGKATTD